MQPVAGSGGYAASRQVPQGTASHRVTPCSCQARGHSGRAPPPLGHWRICSGGHGAPWAASRPGSWEIARPFSLVRSNALLVVERYRENVPVLRHEALHFIIWRAFKRYGHPDEFFMPCDKAYPE
jgi:hypothetical protein